MGDRYYSNGAGGELDCTDCCGYHYSLEYAGVDIVVSKEVPEKFPGVILVKDGVTHIEIFCDDACMMKNPDEDPLCSQSAVDIDIPYDNVPKDARCYECGKILRN